MNTIDGLRLSYCASQLMQAQNFGAEFELMVLEEFVQLRKISTVPDVVPRLKSFKDSLEAVAKCVGEIITELERT